MENNQKTRVKNKKYRWIIPSVILAAFFVYYSLMNLAGTNNKINQLYSEFNPYKNAKTASDSTLFSDSAYLALMKEKAWLQSKTIMAETDSIYLTINLNDSIADLVINGVVVHSAPISRFRTSSIFRKGDEGVLYTLLSAPLSIISSRSTIRKEPLMIKMAPKDTSEYKPDVVPDTAHTQPVNFIFNMTDGIRLYVYQDDRTATGDRIARFIFDLSQRAHDTWEAFKKVAVFKEPEYHPYFKIYITGGDARIIYRALPRKGQISVYL